MTQQQKGVIQPSPLPMSWAVTAVSVPDGTQLVVLQFASPTGTFVSFLDADSALALSGKVRQYARQAKTGLIIPGGGAIDGFLRDKDKG